MDAEATALDAARDADARADLGLATREPVDLAAVGVQLEEAPLEVVVAHGSGELLRHAAECTAGRGLRYCRTSLRATRTALLPLILVAVLACPSAETGSVQGSEAQGRAELPEQIEPPPVRSSWGSSIPELRSRELLAAELTRRAGDPSLLEALDAARTGDEAPGVRERALWSLARIGGAGARERVRSELDGGRGEGHSSLASAALLEVPRSEPGQPPEPSDAWAQLEDGLWTRYAVVDPQDLDGARALLLAIARVGGSRSVARLSVDLAERPGPDHAPALVARWAAAMEVVGLLCARGHSLDEAAVETLLASLEPRVGVDPQISHAALYALSRCARSSSEALAEVREQLVERLAIYAQIGGSEVHAALAWRSFAGLGELPEDIPAALLSASPPAWLVEVEAVRAPGGAPRGAEQLRERLANASLAGFVGPRAHVLLEALRAMRSDIAAAPGVADVQLERLAEGLVARRRSEDPRERKIAALALCELRLLQAIRSGETAALVRCDALSGAPPVSLPASYVVNLEVEALLRATRPEAPTTPRLKVAEIDDEAVIADEPPAGADTLDPGRRARIARLLELAKDPDPARAGPALSALAEIDDPGASSVLRAALDSSDPGVLAAAATAVAVRSIDAAKRDGSLVEALEQLVRSRVAAGELEARLAAIEALGTLGRTAVASIDPNPLAPTAEPESVAASPWLERSVLPLASDANAAVRARAREALLGHDALLGAFDLAEAQSAAARARPFPAELDQALEASLASPPAGLRVDTAVGSFTIEFGGVPAPINQANLAALAKAGFYEGLGFHRVVPGFVVQGGDPRGDGYGGPGYLVPCEWSNLSYVRGTVGMALAGKDTGGSQFFVTQTPQPHLDARYTIIGQIGEGLEVVDSLLPGDTIEHVEVVYF